MGFFDIFKIGESSKSSSRSPNKKKGSSSRKRAERSSSKKRSWLRKSTQPRPTDTSTSAPSTRAQRSAANKKAWAARTAQEKAAFAAAKSTKQPAKTSTASSSKSRTERIKPMIDGSSPTGAKMTRAERSVINKERYRKQRELEMEAAATKRGSKRRGDVFKTRGEYEAYLGSEKWKEKRDEVRNEAQGKCEICGKKGSSVHHLRYTKPGAEAPSHVVYVCNSCHRRIHGTQG